MIRRKTLFEILLAAAICCSVFSQIDSLASIARPLMYGLWLLLIGVSVLVCGGRLRLSPLTKAFLAVYGLYALLCAVCGWFDGAYLRAHYLRVLVVPLLIVVFTDVCPEYAAADYLVFAKVFVLSAVVFAFAVQRTYISSYSEWLSAYEYVYLQKNSAAQVWACAVLLAVFVIRSESRFGRAFWLVLGAYLLLLLGLSQCRTAILALAVGAAVVVLLRAEHKLRWGALFLALAAAAWIWPVTREFIDKTFMLKRYANADLNTFSSGRLEKYTAAARQFFASPVIGVGNWYVDCSYLMILTENGIIGFLLIEAVWIQVVIRNFRERFSGDNGAGIENFIVMLTVFYLVESLLEGYPPFGPGVSAMGFWLFSGLLRRREELAAETAEEIN